jgi:hypothetical protein
MKELIDMEHKRSNEEPMAYTAELRSRHTTPYPGEQEALHARSKS